MLGQYTLGQCRKKARCTAQLSLGTVFLLWGLAPISGATGAVEAGSPTPAELQRALADAIAHPASREALRLDVECTRDGRLPAVAIFGRGVAIWEHKRQFELSSQQVTTLLREVRDSNFARFPESFGESSERDAALKVTCSIAVDTGGARKQVVQFEKGRQSGELRKLADRIYALCEPAARRGVEASDLEDGLAKIASGTLAPETLDVMLHRKPELNAGTPTGGFLLRLSGRALTLRDFDAATGYAAPRAASLDPAELRRLAGELASRRPGRLPANLWTTDYTDLEISVLDQRVAVQARQFTGMTHATGGESQVDFDAVVATLEALRRRLDPAERSGSDAK
jgi:hypothetical protein